MSDKKFLNGKNCYKIAPSDQTDVIIDAALFYKAVYQTILKAKKSLLFSGWQFDSRVSLLRGKDAEAADYPVQFLPLLQRVAAKRPELQIYILAWDHSIVFATEREWWQGYRFHQGPEQIRFEFDSVHPTGGSHHQKIVVADGMVGFCGGLDICGDRWDTPQHRRRNPLRKNTDGTRYDLFHDVQIAVQGPAVAVLEEIFCERWAAATGRKLLLPEDRREHQKENGAPAPWDLPHSVRLPAMPVGISRTVPAGCCGLGEPVQEIACFYLDAIAAAETRIFIENQYFTSRTIFEALVQRMRDKGRPRIEVVIILPHRPQNWKEQLAIGFEQRRMLQRLEGVANETGCRIGVYTPIKKAEGELPAKSIYVHSKVLIVDDRILSIGSANTTNRSLGLDTECNISLEGENDDQRRRIAQSCFTLLAEHLDQPADAAASWFKENKAWVATLDAACKEGKSGRLQKLNEVDTESWIEEVLPGGIYFDPESPLQAESFFEEMLGGDDGGEEIAEGENEGKPGQPPIAAPAPQGKNRLPFKARIAFKAAILFTLPLIGLGLFLYLHPRQEEVLLWLNFLAEVRASRWTIPLFLTGMVGASLISFPILFFLMLGGILFGPLWGTVWSWSGALLGASASYLLGNAFGQPMIKRWGGKKIEAANKWMEKKGFWAILMLRVVGIFPFTVVNFCAGASRIPIAHYLSATALGMLPGTLLISYFANALLEGTVHFPSKKFQVLLVVPILLLWILFTLLKKWWVRRQERILEHA